MRMMTAFLKGFSTFALGLMLAGPADILARPQPTEDGKVGDTKRGEQKGNPAKRAEFRMQILNSGTKPYDPNDLLKAKKHVKAMTVQSSAWPQTQPAASSATIMPLTAGIQRTDWTSIGPGNIGGRTRSLVVHPTNPNILYLGAVGGGIWKSVNGGANWSVLADFMPSIAIGCLVMDPKNPDILWAGTGESYPYDGLRGAGIFKTTDGGVTWNQIPSTANSTFYYVNRMAVHPVNSNILLASTWSGIFRSTDGGMNWSLVLQEVSTDVEWDLLDANKVVATSADKGAYWSSNAGVTWNLATGLPTQCRIDLAYARSNPNIVYASVFWNDGELWRSTDGGKTYSVRNQGSFLLGNQGWYDNTIWVDPLDANNILVGGIGMSISTDGGSTFQGAWVGALHADQHFLVEVGGYSASNRGVYCTNDGGIFRTDNFLNLFNGSHWYSLNNDLAVTQFYAGAGLEGKNLFMGGTQDNGTPLFRGGFNSWQDIGGGDGGWTMVDPNPEPDGSYIWYGEYQNWSTYRLKLDAAGNQVGFNQGLYGSDDYGVFIPPQILDPNTPSRLYKGGSRLWRLDNARTAPPETPWTVVRQQAGIITAIAVAPGNSNIIWVGETGGKVMSTTNGLAANPTWTVRGAGVLPDDNSPLGYKYCTRITIDPANSNRVYVTWGGFDGQNVWKTEDGGATWTNINSNLPNVPIRSLVINKWNTNHIYIGSELGVFASENRGGTWSPTNEGPANASVDELFWVGNKLTAATHGRGMFHITVNTPPTTAITVPINNANFTAGANIGITATASDPDGTIAKVEFFRGSVKIGEDATSPYQTTFTSAPAGSYVLTSKATDNNGGTFVSAGINITVGTSTGISLPGRIQAEDYKAGGPNIGYSDLTAGNTGGQFRTDDVDIEATTDVGAGFNVGWTQAGEWLAYDVNVTATGTYTLTARMASAAGGTKTVAVSVDGGPATNFSFTDASGWQSWRDIVVAGVNLTMGNHVLRITMTTGNMNLNYLDVAGTANQAPIARAGADKNANVNTLVTLDGRTSSDPDNGPQALTYAWTKVSGPAATLNNANTSQPSFTPATTGTYGFRLSVSDGALSSADTVLVNVGSGVVYINLPGRLQVEDYKVGGQNVGFNDLTAANQGGQYRTDAVDIETTSDAGGGFNVGWIQAGEWLAYDVNVASTGSYSLTLRMASGGSAGTKTAAISIDGGAAINFSFSDVSGWQSWKNVVVSGVNLTAGPHVLRITMNNGEFNINYLDVAGAVNQAPVANAGSDRASNVNTSVTLDGRASTDPDNGPQALTYAWTQLTGPTVVLANANTSQPSFAPGAVGTYGFRLTVSDGAASSTDDMVVTVTTGTVYINLPGRIEAEDYKVGGSGVGFNDLSPTNQGGQYRTDAVDIEGASDVGGGFNVGWIQATEWLDYDVNVATTGVYNLTARMASAAAGTKSMTMLVDGNWVGTFNIMDASGWQSWRDVVVSGINLTAGNHVVRFNMSTGDFNLNYLDVQAGGSSNLLQNGDFSNGLVNWQNYIGAPAAATFANEAGAARISINNAGVNTWDIQLNQPVPLTAGKVYTLDFDIKAEATPKSFRVVVEHNGDPWTKYHEATYTVTSAANSYQHFTITWTQSATDAGGRVMFNFGVTNLNDVWLDNIVLK